MKFIETLGVLFIVYATLAQDISHDEQFREEGRDLRDFNQDWKAVDSTHDTSGWIPQPQTEEQPVKRRRIRKRKRRPPVLSDEEFRRKRPQRLDEIKEPWDDVSDEIAQKSNNRRRLTPIYDETQEVIIEPKVQIYERIRDPFTALQEAEEKQRAKVEESKTPDLKTILKQSGGLSLSEVLQEKNLTLSELLQGDQKAISALVADAETTTEVVTSTESVKYRRLPPSIGLRKDNNRSYARGGATNDGLSSREVLEAQRKRLALLHNHKESKLFPGVTKVDVVTEETTERRIFVPSNPKYYSMLDYKPTFESKDIITTTTEAAAKSRNANLPMTSAKLNKMVSKPPVLSKIPENAVSINVNEIFGLNKKNDTEILDGPLKMIIDLGEVTTDNPEENTIEAKTSPSFKILEELTMSTTMSIVEKLKHVTAKEEIMEILKDPIEREHLSKVLRTRNMTVEELVEHRERGSSQLHLADIFHNKTREPEPNDEPYVGHIQIDSFENFLNRKGKTIPMAQVPTTTTTTSTTEQPVKMNNEMVTKLPYTITSFPTYKIETNTDLNMQPFFPLWQQLYPHFFQNVHEDSNKKNSPGVVPSFTTTTTEKIDFEELERLEEIENALAEAANERLNSDLPRHVYEDDEDFINLPSGVKSAILASLAIIGLSLLVFMTILLIFKWSQKQKARLNYTGSFTGSKIRSPILESNQRRTFRTFVSETLGKKRNYYKEHLQSMSDSIWDKDEKKSYMI